MLIHNDQAVSPTESESVEVAPRYAILSLLPSLHTASVCFVHDCLPRGVLLQIWPYRGAPAKLALHTSSSD